MQKVLFRARGSYARENYAQDQRGNVAILFAFSMIPMIGLLGGAVDLMRHSRHEVQIQNAMDAAALALTKRGADNDADADRFVNDYISAVVPATDRMLEVDPFDATKTETGYRVTATGMMQTAFMPIVGVQGLPINLLSEVSTPTGRYEVALALDNTGSMLEPDKTMRSRTKLAALKEASNNLIDILYEETDAQDRVEMALVPFGTAVNIRGAAFKDSWLDPTGAGHGSHQNDSYDRAVSRLDIFDALSNGRKGTDGLPTAWKGCVEARSGASDIDDTAPDGNASTRWTPYLSPDGADEDTTSRNDKERDANEYLLHNDYLKDATRGRGTPLERLRNTEKYFAPMVSAGFDPFDIGTGPNQSCGSPVVELNNDKQRMHTAINAMQATGYTHIPQGLAWGWRVLSPGEPFDQGAPYEDEETQKALVLLSDGKNTFPETYTSYGYRADGRLASSESSGIRRLNEKVSAVCETVKAKGIRLYMILLEENDAATRRIFENCASLDDNGAPLYFEVPGGDALKAAFAEIGKDLTELYVSR